MSTFDRSNPRKYYNNLELNPGPNVTKKRIKEQYQKLAMKWHPDRNNSDMAKFKFAEISEAYSVLVNVEKKREYDRWLDTFESGPRSGIPQSSKQVWMKPKSKFDERMRDNRAMEYETIRRNVKKGYKPPGAKRKDDTLKQDHRTFIHSMDVNNRQEVRNSHEKVQTQRSFEQGDRIKFIFAAVVVVGTALIGTHISNS